VNLLSYLSSDSSAPKSDGAGAGSAPSSAAAAANAAPAAAAAVLLKPDHAWSCLILGGSGATGRVLVSKLANNPRVTRIGALVRKELPLDYFGVQLPANAAKIHQTVVDFEKLDESAAAFNGYDVAFSTLGSTRSKAGSKELFYHYDFDYITHAARLAKAGQVRHFGLMSTGAADPKSMFHYLRTKGEIEGMLNP
jgi:oxidoreductase